MDGVKRILYLSYDGMTDALGQSQVLPYLIGLAREGYSIHLVSFEKEDNFLRLKEEIRETCTKASITWHPQKYTKRPPVLSTVWDLNKMEKLADRLQQEHHFQLVHCRSYIPGIVGMKLKKRYGVRFLFDMRGFWVDERIDGGQWDLSKWIYRKIYSYFKKTEKQLFSSCDECVSLTENGRQELLTWKLDRETPLNITVIPCCVDLAHFDYKRVRETEKEVFRAKYGIQPDDLVICYLGSLSTVYLFDQVLNVIAAVESKYASFKFLVFTHEDHRIVEKYLDASPVRDRSRVIVDSLARKQVPGALSLCHYSVFFCKPTYSRKGTSPTRLAELIACGVKIISNKDVGDSEEHILQHKLGYVFEGFGDEDFKQFIREFELRKDFSKEALHQSSEKLFSLEEGIRKYRQIYQRLLG